MARMLCHACICRLWLAWDAGVGHRGVGVVLQGVGDPLVGPHYIQVADQVQRNGEQPAAGTGKAYACKSKNTSVHSLFSGAERRSSSERPTLGFEGKGHSRPTGPSWPCQLRQRLYACSPERFCPVHLGAVALLRLCGSGHTHREMLPVITELLIS